jgi:hypothetical protein
MVKILITFISIFALSSGGSASPLTLGGFTFPAGEEVFADNGFLVSGTIRWWCGGRTSIPESISGSDLSDCLNNNTGDSGIVEVEFLDNAVVNGPGTDLVVFELSGRLLPGTPDARERFGISIYDGASFTPFAEFDPIATGIESAPGALDIFVVEIDLSDFGFAPGSQTQRFRLHIFDVGLGTKSADIAALGALNSVTIRGCDDGLDNDRDGFTDFVGGDPGCADADDLSERSPLLACDDGVDNDSDGRIDFDQVTFANPGHEYTLPAGEGDPGCKNPTWFTESPQCQDGADNDADGGTDYDAGLSRNGYTDPTGPDPQCVGRPYRNCEKPSCSPCGLGAELALLLPPLMWLWRRRSHH